MEKETVERKIGEILQGAERVTVATHVNPDGDGLGSVAGLALYLERMGKIVYPCIPRLNQLPPQYAYLPGREKIGTCREPEEAPQVFVALDCSNLDRLEALEEKARASRILINVDHHEDNTFYGHLNLVDKEASSTAELVYRIFKDNGWTLDRDVATCLYTGIFTDTGRFQHHNTTPEAFRTAYELALAGADVSRVAREVYQNQSLSYVHLLGLVLERARLLDETGLVYSSVTQEDLKITGASLSETEDLVDYLRTIKGGKVVALFKELEDGRVRVSLRSRDDMPVGPIARKLGGGGHAMAAGYTTERDIGGALEELLSALRGSDR
ncbi:MAG: bifunctional oligoribonuclease/PAP phosphatase NrnA [Candidatus Geothermincolales bacterium]